MTLVIGHRGASADHPENTLAAFEGARAQGADWVELDVRRSADGVLVVHHDPSVPGGGVISATRHRDLPTSVPTLAEALAACAPMGVNVEIKNSPDEAGFDEERTIAALTLEVIAEVGTTPVLVSSFDLAVIDRVRALDPGVPTGYLVLSTLDRHDALALCRDRGHGAVHPHDAFVDQTVVARCRAEGVALNVWTVDDPGRIAQLAAWGVDGVITNRPSLARSVLDAAAG